ncbi:MAG: hypothetical protein NC397_05565 [Clostridium sp.]|nr:hypothetical protein [Clostridium sp.]
MKKMLSVLLAAIMTVSVCAVSVIPAMAAPSPTATTATNKRPSLEVNGVANNKDISYTPDKDDASSITFTYDGEGTITGWENNLDDLGYVEGTDYIATENEDGTYVIDFLNTEALEAFENGDVIVNALVDFDETDAEPTKKNETTKKNDSSKAPATGIATSVIAGSVAVAGAGIAVLSATKKRDAE